MPSQGPVLSNPARAKSREHQQHLAPFTVKEIRDAIPKHCFERSLVHSFAYLLVDIAAVAAFISLGLYFTKHVSEHTSWPVAILFWNLLWFAQGAVMTGIWVIGHECGHQSFSDYKIVNDTVGWIVHSALLVPYHAWRLTHGMHHKSTSHMTRDQVFVPKTRTQVHGKGSDEVHDVIAESPLGNLIQIIITVTIGWPFYLATNAWGQDYGRRTSHFDPNAPMFKPTHRILIILSNIGMIAALGALTYLSLTYSFATVLKAYFVPYLWTNFWLVTITYLQHTDVRVPHFRGEEWNFIRGALSTIDRDYGFLNIVTHHIMDTHVAHHLFSTMPHYHAQEATEAIKPILGEYYMEDRKTPFYTALWKAWNTCHYVEDEGDIVYYKTMDFNSHRKKKM